MFEKVGDLAQIELQIGIAEEDQIAAGLPQPGAQGGAVAQVGRVMDAGDPWVAF